MRRRLNDETGSVAVLTALMITVLLLFTALALDVGMLRLEESKVQTACDAAALAGGSYLDGTAAGQTKARQEAEAILRANGIDTNDVDITFPDEEGKVTIKVEKKATISTNFASIINIKNLGSKKQAEVAATIIPAGGSGTYSFFSGSNTKDVVLNGALSIKGGDAHVNAAFDFNGTSSSLKLDVEDGATYKGTITTCNSVKNADDATDYTADGGIIDDADYVKMPDYRASLKAEAKNSVRDSDAYDTLEDYLEAKYGADYLNNSEYKIEEDVKVRRLSRNAPSGGVGDFQFNIWDVNTGSYSIHKKVDDGSSNVTELGKKLVIGEGCSLWIIGDNTSNQLELLDETVTLESGSSLYFVKSKVRFTKSVSIKQGVIIANGNIVAQELLSAWTGDNRSAIFSEEGDVVFSTTGNQISGLLYAPEGSIVLYPAYSVHVRGSVVADSFSLNGGSLTIDPWPTNIEPYAAAASSTCGGSTGGNGKSKVKLIK